MLTTEVGITAADPENWQDSTIVNSPWYRVEGYYPALATHTPPHTRLCEVMSFGQWGTGEEPSVMVDAQSSFGSHEQFMVCLLP